MNRYWISGEFLGIGPRVLVSQCVEMDNEGDVLTPEHLDPGGIVERLMRERAGHWAAQKAFVVTSIYKFES